MDDDRPTPEEQGEASETLNNFKEVYEAAQLQAKELNELLESPSMKASLQAFSDARKQLDAIAISIPPLQIASFSSDALAYHERPEIGLLRDVHGELEGMATLLTESARQMAGMANITKANLTALQAVITELQETRRAAAWSNGVLIAVTAAVFLATVVGAIALEQEFSRQVAAFWSWVHTFR